MRDRNPPTKAFFVILDKKKADEFFERMDSWYNALSVSPTKTSLIEINGITQFSIEDETHLVERQEEYEDWLIIKARGRYLKFETSVLTKSFARKLASTKTKTSG